MDALIMPINDEAEYEIGNQNEGKHVTLSE